MATELLIVGGERRPATEDNTFTVTEPGTGAPMAEVARGGRRMLVAPWTSRFGPSTKGPGRGRPPRGGGACFSEPRSWSGNASRA
jgi:hypothetical protein